MYKWFKLAVLELKRPTHAKWNRNLEVKQVGSKSIKVYAECLCV